MNEKIYPHNKIVVKKPEDIIAYDYVAPTAQQIFNFVILNALSKKDNTINIKVADYFTWQNIIKPQGKHYMIFRKNLESLKQTFVIAQNIENNKIVKYEWPLIAETKTIKTLTNRIEKIEIKLNPYLLDYYRWQRANVPININTTKKLEAKYAYRLYEYLMYNRRKKNKNKYISIDYLRRILTAPKSERNERFLLYLRKAVKNISETTDLQIRAKIKTKNKKSLASAEIKFVDLSALKVQEQFEFLIFERTLREKNGD